MTLPSPTAPILELPRPARRFDRTLQGSRIGAESTTEAG